jgi:hypothetical protein
MAVRDEHPGAGRADNTEGEDAGEESVANSLGSLAGMGGIRHGSEKLRLS